MARWLKKTQQQQTCVCTLCCHTRAPTPLLTACNTRRRSGTTASTTTAASTASAATDSDLQVSVVLADWDPEFVIRSKTKEPNTVVWAVSGESQLTDRHPPLLIPAGCYDCGDGFYDPNTRVVTTYDGDFLRNAGEAKVSQGDPRWPDLLTFKMRQHLIHIGYVHPGSKWKHSFPEATPMNIKAHFQHFCGGFVIAAHVRTCTIIVSCLSQSKSRVVDIYRYFLGAFWS